MTAGPDAAAVVARRRHLPDLPAVLGGRRRRRHGRPARASPRGCTTSPTLGVDAVWLSPFYTSPQNDAGYDVADYRDVDPRFGTLADADAMIARAHELGLRVLVDIVPNHSSSEHPWFQAGSRRRRRAAPPGLATCSATGAGENGELPPNNWRERLRRPGLDAGDRGRRSPGQWYLHLFDVTQPDFDWTNPEVGDEMESVLRFWLDRGVDGFRIDVAHGLVKARRPAGRAGGRRRHHEERTAELPMWDQPGVHDIYRRWRKVTDSYAVDGRGRRPDPLRRGVGAADRRAGAVRPAATSCTSASTSAS